MTIDVDPRWYEDFFEGEWLDHLLVPFDEERTAAEVELVWEELGLAPGVRVLDLGCGIGRLAIPLAQRGCSVVGLDLSPRSLELARERAAAAGAEIEWVHASMLELDREAEFDAVLNYFSTFGYLEREEDDQRVLDAVSRALKPGGRFLLEQINAPALFARFGPVDWQELDGGVLMLERREYGVLSGRTNAAWTFVRPDGSRTEIRHSMRLYTPRELVLMLGAAGLEVERATTPDRGELTLDAFRLVLVARKPA